MLYLTDSYTPLSSGPGGSERVSLAAAQSTKTLLPLPFLRGKDRERAAQDIPNPKAEPERSPTPHGQKN